MSVGDNQNIEWCNFTLIDCDNNIILDNQNGSILGNTTTSQNIFINKTGEYYATVNCTSNIDLNVSKGFYFNISYYFSQPSDFSFTAITEKNETQNFNLTFYDNTNGTIIYNLTSAIEDKNNFTMSLTPSIITLNDSDTNNNPFYVLFSINASSDVANASYAGNITLTNSTYNLTYIIDFTYHINPPAGIAHIYNDDGSHLCNSLSSGICAVNQNVKIGDSYSIDYIINNTGKFDMSGCNGKFANNTFGYNQFSDIGWISYSKNNFDLNIAETQFLSVTFSPTTGSDISTDYLGYFYIKCDNGDFVGNVVESNINNRPYVKVNVNVADSTPPPPPGGGGGGTTIITIGTTNETQWTMQTREGNVKYELNMIPGTIRSKDILFENLGTSSREISMSCEDIKGDLCQYVEFDETTFILPLVKDIKTVRTFTISPKLDIDKKTYIFNIKAIDELENYGVVTTTVDFELSFLQLIATKIVSSNDIGGYKIPNILLFLLIWIILTILFYFSILKRFNIGAFLSVIIAFIISSLAMLII